MFASHGSCFLFKRTPALWTAGLTPQPPRARVRLQILSTCYMIALTFYETIYYLQLSLHCTWVFFIAADKGDVFVLPPKPF